MTNSSENTIDMTALVSSLLSGDKGFANTKRMKRMGTDGYIQWLTEKLAQKAAFQINDPRRKKRSIRSA